MNTEIINTMKLFDFEDELNILKHKKDEIYVISYGIKSVRVVADEKPLKDIEVTEVLECLCIIDNSDNKVNRRGLLMQVALDDYELFEGEITISN